MTGSLLSLIPESLAAEGMAMAAVLERLTRKLDLKDRT